MAQTVQLKRSSVAGKIPTTSDLALGEIAINTYDGKVFIKKDDGTAAVVEVGAGSGGSTDLSYSANSTTVQINSSTGTDISIAGANSTVSGVLTADTQTIGGSKTFKGPDILFDNGPGGDEGGEIRMSIASTSTISGPVVIDIFQDKLRIFESGGSNRGAYIDISGASAGVASNLLSGGGGGATNLTSSANGSTFSIFSDTGTDVTIPGANSTTAGILTSEAQTIGGVKTFSSTIVGSVDGNAGTATALQTPRNINGVTFDGTANITVTAATPNNLTIGSGLSGTSFNGSAAVTIAIDSTVATLTGTQTLTNKTLQSRVVTYSDSTSITINGDTTDVALMFNTQAAGTFTIDAPTGTPYDGQKILFRLKSTNVQTFSWNAIFVGSTDAALPTASTGSGSIDYMGFVYESVSAKWQLVAKNFGF